MTTIPTKFEPPSWYDEHLDFKKGETLCEICWPLLGLSVFSSKEIYPNLEEVMKKTPGFKPHGRQGYSLGQFHEFFVSNPPKYYECKLGRAGASVGEVTPLGIYLFDSYFDNNYFGDWDCVASVRILGIPPELVEAYLLNFLIRYFQRFKITLNVFSIKVPEDWCDELQPEEERPTIKERDSLLPAVNELIPLRLFCYASRDMDDCSACIQYYRVLEYYAFFEQEREFSHLRCDKSMSDREFLTKAATMLTSSERIPLERLIKGLADGVLLNRALEASLIAKDDADILATTLYMFRNSIVHAKYGYRLSIHTDSILDETSVCRSWRGILEKLAWAAIDRFSRKDL
ncbi:MAG: hypothetical protein ABII79_12905 [bacterium]